MKRFIRLTREIQSGGKFCYIARLLKILYTWCASFETNLTINPPKFFQKDESQCLKLHLSYTREIVSRNYIQVRSKCFLFHRYFIP